MEWRRVGLYKASIQSKMARASSAAGRPAVPVEQLDLQGGEEALGDGVDAPICQDGARSGLQDALRRPRRGSVVWRVRAIRGGRRRCGRGGRS